MQKIPWFTLVKLSHDLGWFQKNVAKAWKKERQVGFGIAQIITDISWMEGASSDTVPATLVEAACFTHKLACIWVSKGRHFFPPLSSLS